MALENEYLVKGESIKGVADAIRAKTSAADELSFPEGFKTAISGIKTEKPEQEKTVSASPDAEVVVSPDSGKVLSKVTVGKIPRATGNGIIDYPDSNDPHKAIFKINLASPGYLDSENVDSMGMGLYAYLEEEIIPGTTDTVLESGRYIDGNITIKGDANLAAGNIKSGSSIFGVNGTFTSDATATSGKILKSETAYVKGQKVTGTIPSQQGSTVTPGTAVKTAIPAGTYAAGDIKVAGDSNLVSGNIKSGVSIFGVSGNKNIVNTTLADTVKAGPLQIMVDKKCYVNGELVTGTMPTVKPTATASLNTATGEVTPTASINYGCATSGQYAGTTLQLPTVQGTLITPGTTSQTVIPAGKYTLSDTVVQGDADLLPENIKSGVEIFGVSGTYIGDTTKATFEVNEDQSSNPWKIAVVASTGGRVESGDVVGEIPQADLYYANNGVTGCDILVNTTGACFGGDAPLTIPYYEGSVVFQDIQDNTDSFNISVYADGLGDGYIPPDGSYVIGSSGILKSDLASLESGCKPENIKKGATILGVEGTFEGGGGAGNTWYQHTISFSSELASSDSYDNYVEISDASITIVNNSSSEIQSLSALIDALKNYGAISSTSGIPCGGYGGYVHDGKYGWILKTWAQNYAIYFYIHVVGTSTYTTVSVNSDANNEGYYTTVTDTVKTLGVVSPTMVLSTDSNGKKVLTITDNL